MGCRSIRGLSFVAFILVAFCPESVSAQLPPCVEKRLPYPTLAQEIHSENAGQPITSVVVGDLRIEGDVHDPGAVRSRILRKLEACSFESEAALRKYVEVSSLQEDFQRRGYYQVQVNTEVQRADIKDNNQRMLVIAHVKEGIQFRLSKITFENGNIFREGFLRKAIPIRDGDILDIDKIRGGNQKITRFYGRIGHIDATIQPIPQVDEASRSIAIAMWISEGPQYSIEEVEVLGLSPESEARLRSYVSPRDLCDTGIIEGVFNMNKSSVPHGTRLEDVVQIIRDTHKNTARVVFDFRNPSERSN
jgi:hypothetical protein